MVAKIRNIASLLLGIASVILSYWMLGFFALATAYLNYTNFTQHTGQSWRSFVFVITGPGQFHYLLIWLALAALLGGLGYWLADHRAKTKLVASAIRFCLGGLLGALLDAFFIAVLLGYRWLA